MNTLPGATQAKLLDTVMDLLEVKYDAHLARKLAISPTLVSRVRHGKAPVSDRMLLAMHELTGLSFLALRFLAGSYSLPRSLSSAQARDPKHMH